MPILQWPVVITAVVGNMDTHNNNRKLLPYYNEVHTSLLLINMYTGSLGLYNNWTLFDNIQINMLCPGMMGYLCSKIYGQFYQLAQRTPIVTNKSYTTTTQLYIVLYIQYQQSSCRSWCRWTPVQPWIQLVWHQTVWVEHSHLMWSV